MPTTTLFVALAPTTTNVALGMGFGFALPSPNSHFPMIVTFIVRWRGIFGAIWPVCLMRGGLGGGGSAAVVRLP
jgi:hypothetical protein